MYTAENSEYFDVYAPAKKCRHKTWNDMTNTFTGPAGARWHTLTGDFWGGILTPCKAQGGWPRIEDLFQTGVEHRFRFMEYANTLQVVRER
jgi:hypothetical protein